MIWRDTGASAAGEIDPERELELRLVAHAHAGAAWALSSLVARYQPPVVRYLIRLTGDQERAHALAEQVFVRMARRIRGPHRGEQLRLWLLRTSTEVGLDVLRRPVGRGPARLTAPARSPALLPGQVREGAVMRLLHSIGARYRKRHTPRLAPPTQEFVWSDADRGQGLNGRAGAVAETLSPREQVRHRLIRAVLAELAYSDAQCLALHLVAGLNQTEVALALGVAAPIARRRIVQGLQLFARRYEATLASLGLPKDFADADVANVRFTESGAVIARSGVLDETGVAEGASDESEALRREREVTGTLVVPNRALPALEEFFANEPVSPQPGAPAAAMPAPDVAASEAAPAAPSPLDPLAAATVFLPEVPVEALEAWSAAASSSEPAPPAPDLPADLLSTASADEPTTTLSASDVEEPAAAPAAPMAGALGTDRPPIVAEPDEWGDLATSGPATAIAEGEYAKLARVVPVLAAAPSVMGTSTPTRPLDALPEDAPTVEPAQAGSKPADYAAESTVTEPALPSGATILARQDHGDDLLIEWGSNPQIPIHVRSDINALLGRQDVAAPSATHDDSDWLLVLEDEQEDAATSSLESRRRRVLSADGEAEDPDESMW
jgi:DNA-directed RNA polymerase specialized sigma24 family protein